MQLFSRTQPATLTLIIPNLFPKEMTGYDIKSLPLPYLKKFLQRANKQSHEYLPNELLLLSLFNLPARVPNAAIAALGEGLPATQGWWLYADPVQWQADMTHVYLQEHLLDQVTAVEAVDLIAELNQLLNSDGMQLYNGKQHWYLHLAEEPKINTTPLFAVLGKELRDAMPTGSQAKKWRGLMTEIQMLMHGNYVNAQRKLAAKPVINSLWFWGVSKLPDAISPTWNKVWSDDVVAKGLALLTQTALEGLPGQFDLGMLQDQNAGNNLVVFAEQSINDISTWHEKLFYFETAWFMPLFKAMREKHLKQVIVYPNSQYCYELNQQNIRHWWKWMLKS